MTTKILQKYNSKSISDLKKTATKWFNEYIRLRDTDSNEVGNCISSGRVLKVPSSNAHAGHYYPGGHYPLLKFNEDNVHLQSKSDNYFKSGNQIEYRKNLEKKIGLDAVKKLDEIADQSKRISFKWDRFMLIDIIETYKAKVKRLKQEKCN